MAGNISTAAAFTTANMKPVSGEQIDALWGQNIADNTGYLFYRPYVAATLGGIGRPYTDGAFGGTSVATVYFQKLPEYENLHGSFVGTTNAAGNLRAYVNGALVFSQGGAGSTWKSGTSISIAGLVDGDFYELSCVAEFSSAGASNFSGLTWWLVP